MIILKDIDINNLDFSYNIFSIKKLDGNERVITAPNDNLKNIQKELKDRIEKSENEKIPNYITGFRKGLSIKDNASFHVNKKIVINIDIKNFFGSISKDKIEGYFKDKVDDINKFVKLTTYNGVLATGSPTSPIIGNLIFLKLDDKIYSYLERKFNGFNYSRYVDDITISFNENIDTKKVIEHIEFIINENNFNINQDKKKIISNKHQQIVTGLVVNEKVSYPRYNYRNLRSQIYNYIIKGFGYFPEIKGHLNYLYGVDKHKFEILKNYYSKYEDNPKYIDLFVGTIRPILVKSYSYTSRNSRKGTCFRDESYGDIEVDFYTTYGITQ